MSHVKLNQMPKLILIFLAFSLYSISSQAKSKTVWSDISQRVEKRLQKSKIAGDNWGILVSLSHEDGEKIIFEHNSKKSFIPASLSKIMTAGASLHHLGIGYKFKTQLHVSQAPQKGVVKGSLYLKGGGDPSFVSEDMWALVNEFVRSGIQKIEGDIIVDDLRFDDVRFDKSRENRRVDRAYDAPVSAMSFNWNSINVYVRPGKKRGEHGQVFLDPKNTYTKLVNKTKTVGGRKKNLKVSRSAGKPGEGDVITVSGQIGINRDEAVIYKSITQPALWTGFHLKEFLSQRGVQVMGSVKLGSTPEKTLLLAERESKGLGAIVGDMMKFSNNYVAEMLTKNIMAEKESSKRATIEGGMKHIHDFLRESGLTKKSYTMVNPSGLTRDNQFSPQQVSSVLKYIRNHFQLFPEFMHSLPISGVDGTLKKRMVGSRAQGWIRAKTGMLNGVLGLAGFAGRSDGSILTFVFLYNGSHGKINGALRSIDLMAQELVK